MSVRKTLFFQELRRLLQLNEESDSVFTELLENEDDNTDIPELTTSNSSNVEGGADNEKTPFLLKKQRVM